MFRFANPQIFYLLFLLVGMIAVASGLRYIHHLGMKRYAEKKIRKLLLVGYSTSRFWVKIVLLSLGIVFLIIAMARPQYGKNTQEEKSRGIEIVVALDVSNSMLCEDVKPNRLTCAKMMLTKLLEDRSSDKMGLVVFAGQAYTQMPLTADKSSLRMFLSAINTNMVGVQGTNVAEALDLSSKNFTINPQVGHAIILITDGEDHEDAAIDIARTLAKQGVKIYVVGVGTPSGGTIPMGNGVLKRDKNGSVVVTHLNEEMGVRLAQASGGIYIRCDNLGAYRILAAELDKLDKLDNETITFAVYNERYRVYLFIAFLLFFLEGIMLERQNRIFAKIRIFRR